jgi:hypothetical protein
MSMKSFQKLICQVTQFEYKLSLEYNIPEDISESVKLSSGSDS